MLDSGLSPSQPLARTSALPMDPEMLQSLVKGLTKFKQSLAAMKSEYNSLLSRVTNIDQRVAKLELASNTGPPRRDFGPVPPYTTVKTMSVPSGQPSTLGSLPPKTPLQVVHQQSTSTSSPGYGAPQGSQPAFTILPRPTVSPIQETPFLAASSVLPTPSSSVSANELASFGDRFNLMEGQLSGMINSLAQYLPADNQQSHRSSSSSPNHSS
jgi:hypothetical protein